MDKLIKIFQGIPKDEIKKYIGIAKERGYIRIVIHKDTWRTVNIWGVNDVVD